MIKEVRIPYTHTYLYVSFSVLVRLNDGDRKKRVIYIAPISFLPNIFLYAAHVQHIIAK